ncbi:MAG: flagellar biosynthetic protein FliQ [Anaerohalosphaera sp.]|nr:flagellar biosynthetic protein FliQ [Anaerohalosphaera sp.]
MDSGFALYLGRHTLETTMLLCAPILITCIVVGVIVTLVQAVTSIRDMTLSIVPKLLAAGIVAIMFSGWSLQVLVKFTTEIFGYIQTIGQ